MTLPVPGPGTTGPGGQPIGEPDRDRLPDEENGGPSYAMRDVT
ncbi:hypothetical protein OIU34_33710 [Pararhizobium sp. BT-229]|nr:hypothetical protein [Pararhizobium sp. BT-229]MCV9966814.1 hypothetical protein [Pararhizobium sp. BT-229]